MTSFASSCEEVLRGNDRGGHTVPSPRLYPHQWAWDSAFAAIGWAHVAPARAWRELGTLMGGQWADGRVPHIKFHDPTADYFPGPDLWGARDSSTITQPPMWATAARRVVEVSGLSDALEDLLPRFEASHRFFAEQRDPSGIGLVAVSHPWESGLDNCPVWDGPLSRIDPGSGPPLRRTDLGAVADAGQRPTEDQYARYMAIVRAIALDSFGPGPFRVYDPFVSAVLARAEEDLAWLADRLGVQSHAASRAARIREALVNHLWDGALGRFVYLDASNGERITADVIGCYSGLFCGVEEPIAARLLEGLEARYGTRWRLPSTAPTDPAFDARRYWRGPVWINVNWLLGPRMGLDFVRHTLELVRTSGIREYFDPLTGEGLGGERFTWTAALCLDLMATLR